MAAQNKSAEPNPARARVSRVFRFLEAFNQVRNPVPRIVTEQWHFWLDEAPQTPYVTSATIHEAPPDSDDTQEEPWVLRVRRPKLTDCPRPPVALDGWVEEGWQDPDKPSRLKAVLVASGEGEAVQFAASRERVEARGPWEATRSRWAASESPLRKGDRLFQRLYQLHGDLGRESERLELLLGDAHLVWARPEGDVHHPVVLRPVQLEFDPNVPEFRVVETDREVELYSALLRNFEDVDGTAIGKCREEVAQLGIHPLAGELTNGFLRRLALTLSAKGQLAEGQGKPAPTEAPQLYRRPLLFVRPRAVGFAKVLGSIIADVEAGGALPASLTRIVGVSNVDRASSDAEGRFNASDVLLSKEANAEQVAIVQRLHDHGAVLVQGPPGTGKSHTIGNLIGHLLANGKSVLVTSHTTKALKVLRSHVVDDLRALCVSILDSDVESRRELEQAVTAIAGRLASMDKAKLSAEAKDLAVAREKLRSQVDHDRAVLRDARMDEHREVVVAEERWSPCESARLVAAGVDANNWVPPPVKAGTTAPLSHAEVEELYKTNEDVSEDQERKLSEDLPDLESVPHPAEFDALVSEAKEKALYPVEPQWWTVSALDQEPDDLVEAHRNLATVAQRLRDGAEWAKDAALAGIVNNRAAQPWVALADEIDKASSLQSASSEVLVRYDPRLPDGADLDAAIRVATEIAAHLEAGGALGALRLLTRREWARLIKSCSINNGAPSRKEHFEAIRAEAELRKIRSDLARRWERLMEAGGAPKWAELGRKPEVACAQFATEVRKFIGWRSHVLEPAISRLRNLGFQWGEFIEAHPVIHGERAALDRLLHPVTEHLPQAIQGRLAEVRGCRSRARLAALERKLKAGPAATSQIQREMAEAVASADTNRFRLAHGEAALLHSLDEVAHRREALLRKVEASAPGWAGALRRRAGVHGKALPPGDIGTAWRWIQLKEELDRRAERSLAVLQEKLEASEQALREGTVKLIDRQAWAAQLERSSLPQRQALVGWLDLIRRIGKGTGKRAPILQAQAARQMQQCRTAVPVWIMPLARVAEMFDGGARFDVVIIDEASQCDVMGLVALYMGRSVVVVGDHEQVSPSAVGQQIGAIGKLIDEHLEGIPNKVLYDGKTSIYDLARQSFGGLLRLNEHFRCHPLIIEFSNWLSYNGTIRPLREPGLGALAPPVVHYAVKGASCADKLNRVEAAHVASLVAACCSQPEYRDATFGVVSLLGDEQAFEIERHLRTRIPESEYARRRILCGNAAQFQGDERDVVFLSLVKASEGAPLARLTEQMYQQRFNVAASRARDQMWVVNSLDVNLDLRPEDLRRRLIEHALDPAARNRLVERTAKRAESDFERRVLERLIHAGYEVHPQYSVGAYRIDLVVVGEGGRRLAVECDGERFHTLQNLDEDMARQAILERLGWKFVRIRGSLFYRAASRAMAPVFERLERLGIGPRPSTAAAPTPNELLERVIRRSEVLRREWGLEVAPELAAVEGAASETAAPIGKHEDATTSLPNPHEAVPDRQANAKAPEGASATGTERGLPVDPPKHPVPPPKEDDAPVPTAPRKAVDRKMLVLEKVAPRVPAEHRTCPECAKPLKVTLGPYGPYLKCGSGECKWTRSVAYDLVDAAVKDAAMPCECGGQLRLKRGPTTFLGCTMYPTCRKPIAWRDL